MRSRSLLLALCLAGAGDAPAQSNVEPAQSLALSSTIGPITFAPGESSGARINQFYCAGFLYSQNVGWIQLGAGEPANGWQYQTNSVSDFGVNVLPSGALRGFAYGANIGWINFEETGDPQVDWATGRLTGRIYSANTGWIELAPAGQHIELDSVAPAADSDADSLPDAWEIEQSGGLLALRGTADADQDGQTDFAEFLAATNPLNAGDFLFLDLTSTSAETFVSWETRYGVVYQLEARESFTATTPWTSATTPFAGTGAIAEVEVDPAQSPSSFFRLTAHPPLSSP